MQMIKISICVTMRRWRRLAKSRCRLSFRVQNTHTKKPWHEKFFNFFTFFPYWKLKYCIFICDLFTKSSTRNQRSYKNCKYESLLVFFQTLRASMMQLLLRQLVLLSRFVILWCTNYIIHLIYKSFRWTSFQWTHQRNLPQKTLKRRSWGER